MAVRIQLRRDTAANWVSSNPTLRAGEIGIETDTLKFKVGTGSTPWNSITAYANVVPSDLNNTLNGYLEVSDLSKDEGVGVAELLDGDLTLPGLNIIFEGTVDNHEFTLTAPDPTADRTVTLPDATTTLVGTDVAQTLTNKTLTSPVISGLSLSDASIVFEGAVADSYETTLTVGEPTADRTLTLPDATGTVALTSNIPSTTDGLSEGSTNKYFTDERAQDAIATAIAAGTHTNITITYDDDNNKFSFTGAQTYSDENAQDAVGNAVGNGLDYDDSSGAISVDPSEFALSAVGAPTGNVDFATYKITNLGAPTSANDAATKAYVDNTTAGLNFHAAVHAATTANLDATYANGTGGVGATLTANANGALVVDGHTLNAAERVLVKNQTAGLENGIYVVTATGDASNPYILTRATDADNSPAGEMAYGDFTFVQNGTANAGFGYIVNTTGTITIGTTAISYVQFNAGQAVVAGNGLTESTPGTLAINTAVTVDLNTAQTLTNKTITGTFTGNLTGNADTVTNGVYTNAANTITAASASTKPLIIKGAASQSANLQEWQDSSGTMLSAITSTGIGKLAYIYTNIVQGWNGVGGSINFANATPITITPQSSSVAVIVAKGAASQSANLQEWQDSAGSLLGFMNAYGTLTANNRMYAGWAAFGSGFGTFASASNVVLIAKGAASQTADLQQWQNSSGTVLANVAANGVINVAGIVSGASGIRSNAAASVQLPIFTDSAQLAVGTAGAGFKGIIIRGASSQTASLQEWQNSSGTALASINASGQFVGDGSQLTGLTTALTTPSTVTLSANTATTVDTTALSGFTSIEYMVSLKQGSKVRTSKVVLQTDGTSVDMTEFAITETGGTMSGVVISATTASTDAVLQATVTDASSTNVTVKLAKIKL